MATASLRSRWAARRLNRLGGEFKVSFVHARLGEHPAWPGLESRLAAVLTPSPELAQAVAAVLMKQESPEEEEWAPESDGAD